MSSSQTNQEENTSSSLSSKARRFLGFGGGSSSSGKDKDGSKDTSNNSSNGSIEIVHPPGVGAGATAIPSTIASAAARSTHVRSPQLSRTRSPLVQQQQSLPTISQNSNSVIGNYQHQTQDYHHQDLNMSQRAYSSNSPSVANVMAVKDFKRKNSMPVISNTELTSNGKIRRPSNNLPSETSTIGANHINAHGPRGIVELPQAHNSSSPRLGPSGGPQQHYQYMKNARFGNSQDSQQQFSYNRQQANPSSKASNRDNSVGFISNDDPPVELDTDFIECIHDFLVTIDVQDKEEFFRLRQFLDVFLSRLHRRLNRKYPVVDCFAAAAVGARRLLSFLGHSMSPNTAALELGIARTLAGLLVDAKTLDDVMIRQGIDAAVMTLDEFRIKSSVDRQQLVDQIASEYLKRADAWTPATAAKASHLRKKKAKRERFLSVFMELEEAKVAMNMNEKDRERMNRRDDYHDYDRHHYSPSTSSPYSMSQQQQQRYPHRKSNADSNTSQVGLAKPGTLYPFDSTHATTSTPYSSSSASTGYNQQHNLMKSNASDNTGSTPGYARRPSNSSSISSPMGGARKSSITSDRRPSNLNSDGNLRKPSLMEINHRQDHLSASSSIPGSPTMAHGRRGSAEALLQSVLDECESLIGTLHVNKK